MRHSLNHSLNVVSSIATSTAGGWRGSLVRHVATAPPKPLQLYEFEACPYCRVVRYALTELDLDAMILPCPKGGLRFRPQAIERGGKRQFPLLVDVNTGRTLYESADIVRYLIREYVSASTARRSGLVAQLLSRSLSVLSSASRPLRGLRARPSRAAQQPLELYSFESSPYSRLVREVLCELELPYLLRSTGKARASDIGPPWVRDRLFKAPQATSRNRARLLELTGRVQVPYLIDPNRADGKGLFESADIIAYLEQTYAA